MRRGCRCWVVRGRVQGVGFRRATQEQARTLGITGLVRNMADGSVEVIGCGVTCALDTLGAWLAGGPRFARVSAVEMRTIGDPDCESFEVL